MNRSKGLLSIVVFVAMFSSSVQAQEQDIQIQPSVVLAIYEDGEGDQSGDVQARTLVATAIEGRLRADLRYRLSRRIIAEDPDRYLAGIDTGERGPAVVIVRLAPRRDGSLRVELDLWRSGEYRWSMEEQLPAGDDRFLIVDALTASLSREIAALYPGFGRVRFTNQGATADYYVFADGVYLGANLPAIELPVGRYDFEIRRREDSFEHVIGRSSIEIAPDGLYELQFELGEDPPLVPAYLRLADPEDRWRVLFDSTVLYTVSLFDVGDFVELDSAMVIATALFNNVLFRNHVFGFMGGYSSTWYDDESTSSELSLTPIMAATGFTAGPVAGIDVVFLLAGGVAATSSDFVYTDDDDVEQRYEAQGLSPAYNGSMQFGFGVYRALRLSMTTSVFGVVEDGVAYNWIAFGLGLGARF